MKKENRYCIITTACDKKEIAKKITETLLQERLVVCVQESKRFSSWRWKGKIERQEEFILTMKTKVSLYQSVEKTILSIHDYEVPEIAMIEIIDGSQEFLKWIEEETK